jgi:hypothetical protein
MNVDKTYKETTLTTVEGKQISFVYCVNDDNADFNIKKQNLEKLGYKFQ